MNAGQIPLYGLCYPQPVIKARGHLPEILLGLASDRARLQLLGLEFPVPDVLLGSQALFVCSAGMDEEGWGQQGWLVLLHFPS